MLVFIVHPWLLESHDITRVSRVSHNNPMGSREEGPPIRGPAIKAVFPMYS